MRKFFILGVILFSPLCIGQNSHNILFGVNYPFMSSESNIARGIGIEFGYLYSIILNKYYSINTGIRFDIYEKFEEKMMSLDIILPIKLGFSNRNFRISGGLTLNAAQFLSFGKYMGPDPDLGIGVIRSPYFDLNTKQTFSIGINATFDYKLSKKNLIFLDLLSIKLNDKDYRNLKYTNGILTIGVKHRINN